MKHTKSILLSLLCLSLLLSACTSADPEKAFADSILQDRGILFQQNLLKNTKYLLTKAAFSGMITVERAVLWLRLAR